MTFKRMNHDPSEPGYESLGHLGDVVELLRQANDRLEMATATAANTLDESEALKHKRNLLAIAIADGTFALQRGISPFVLGTTSQSLGDDIAGAHELLLRQVREAEDPEEAAPFEGARQTLLRLWMPDDVAPRNVPVEREPLPWHSLRDVVTSIWQCAIRVVRPTSSGIPST